MITFTPYEPEDKNGCLRVFRSNVPDCFSSQEEEEFSAFLDRRASAYFTLKTGEGEILACSGYKLHPDGRSARFRWDMVDSAYHGQGLGKVMVYARMSRLLPMETIEVIHAIANQFSSGFYQKFGFEIVKATPNGICPGFDEILLDLTLDPERRSWIQLRWQAIETLMRDLDPVHRG
jgi:RimJ/RimL family protein N-acetyltransferase